MSKTCSVCENPAKTKGFCPKHYQRNLKYGDPLHTGNPGIETKHTKDAPYNEKYGTRSKDPLYESWRSTRNKESTRVKAWDNFKTFKDHIGLRPEDHRLCRLDSKKPWGPKNFYWRKVNAAWKDQGPKKYQNEYYIKNKDQYLKKLYGISLQEYNKMLEDQNGVCALCKGNPEPKKALAVDHCHKSGKVRALLCSWCNTALGLFKDDPVLAVKASEYLKEHR